MSHDKKFNSGEENLIYMANQIATFFTSQPGDHAADDVADHINKFWEPRMRRHLFEIIERGGSGLSPFVVKVADSIRRPQAA